MTPCKKSSAPSLITLLLLVSYPSVGAVLFTPSLPTIAKFFHVSGSAAQWTVTLFLIGYAIGQLPYGPLSNAIGRKPALSIGLLISIAGSFLCSLAGFFHLFWVLILARIITALGASVGLMMTFTILSDYYTQEEARKKLGFVITAFALAPGLAVTVGGIFTQLLSWESTFYVQAFYGIFLYFLCRRLPETSAAAATLSKESLHLKAMLDGYVKRCNNAKLLFCGLIQGSCTSFVYIFAALAPFLIIHLLGYSPSMYGFLNLIPSIGMLLGSILSHKTARYLSPYQSIFLGLMLMFPSTLSMLFLFALGYFNLWTLFIPYFFINMGITLAYINCPTIATGNAKNKPNASAVLSFLNISMCVLTVFVLQALHSQKPIIMPLLFISLLALLLPFHRLLGRHLSHS